MKPQLSPTVLLLDKIRCALSYDETHWANALKLSKGQYHRIFKSGTAKLPASALFEICEYLELDATKLHQGNVDIPLLARQVRGNKTALPERYTAAAFGTMRTSLNILNYTSAFLGYEKRQDLLRSIQVKEDVFASPDMPVSIFMGTDLMNAMRENGATAAHIFMAGAYSSVTNANTPLASLLGRYDDPRTLYAELFAEYTPLIERNHKYTLTKLTDDYCIVSSVAHDEVTGVLGTRDIGSATSCLFRAGVMSSQTRYANMPHTEVIETECVYRGDAACKFVVNYREAAAHTRARQH